jgi:hypothetical protein
MEKRMMGRVLARGLTDEELDLVSGGSEGDPGPPVDTVVRTNVSPQGDTEKIPDPRNVPA